MRFVSVRQLRSQSEKIFGNLDREEVVVTSNGTPVALLTPFSADTLDASLRAHRQAQTVMAMAALQESAAERGPDRLSDEEIMAEITSARQEHKQNRRDRQ